MNGGRAQVDVPGTERRRSHGAALQACACAWYNITLYNVAIVYTNTSIFYYTIVIASSSIQQ